MIKVDLHTHSIASADGGISFSQYQVMLKSQQLDVIAVTDHNRIDAAQALHEKWGDKIIIGEEISTYSGDVIGLYLHTKIAPNLGIVETVNEIRRQKGVVYIPHPFDSLRRSTGTVASKLIPHDIDIIETFNGRMIFPIYNERAQELAESLGIPGAASSDAHGWLGWGKTYSVITQMPTAATLKVLLQHAALSNRRSGWRASFYPSYNRMRKGLAREK